MDLHWKALDLKITDFKNHHDPTPSGEFIEGCYFVMRDGVKYPTSGSS